MVASIKKKRMMMPPIEFLQVPEVFCVVTFSEKKGKKCDS
jgi:hypothetical protein